MVAPKFRGMMPLLCFVLLTLPAMAGAQTILNGYFVEDNGILVMEAESIGTFPDDWKNASTSTAPNLDLSQGLPTGGDYLSWEGEQFLEDPGVSVLVYRFQINNAGLFRFRWRSQVGLGTDTTEHNDTWLRIEADSFYGDRDGGSSIVCPIGYDPAENDCTGGVPNGDGADGWFKVYNTGANSWSWNAITSDFDGHRIFARFDQPGLYELKLSVRSSFHIIDRIVLHSDLYPNSPTSTDIPESEFVPDNLPPNPDNMFKDGFEAP